MYLLHRYEYALIIFRFNTGTHSCSIPLGLSCGVVLFFLMEKQTQTTSSKGYLSHEMGIVLQVLVLTYLHLHTIITTSFGFCVCLWLNCVGMSYIVTFTVTHFGNTTLKFKQCCWQLASIVNSV